MSIRPEAFTLGVPLIAAYLITLARLRRRPRLRREVDYLLFAVALSFLLAWKLSPLLFHTGAVLRAPVILLSYPPGREGLFAGTAASFIIGGVRLLRRRIPLRFLAAPLAIFAGAALIPATALTLALPRLRLSPGMTALVSRPAPDFALCSLAGQEYRLRDQRGRTVILNFWATWCLPCRAELPELIRFANSITSRPPANGRGPLLLSVNLTSSEQNVDRVSSTVRREDIPFPVLLDPDGAVATRYHVTSIPTTLLIDAGGIVIARKVGPVNYDWLKRSISRTD